MKSVVIGLVLLCSVNAFASSYGESKLSNCGTFDLIEATVGSQQPDGTLVSETRYMIRFVNGTEMRAEKAQFENVDRWTVTTAPDTLLVVSKSFQHRVVVYISSIVKQGKTIFSKECDQSDVILY